MIPLKEFLGRESQSLKMVVKAAIVAISEFGYAQSTTSVQMSTKDAMQILLSKNGVNGLPVDVRNRVVDLLNTSEKVDKKADEIIATMDEKIVQMTRIKPSMFKKIAGIVSTHI